MDKQKLGKSLQVEAKKTWMAVMMTILAILLNLSLAKMAYHIWLFGTIGGFISILFIALVWYWGKAHTKLEGTAR